MNEKQLSVLAELKSIALQYFTEFGHRLPITGELGELLVCEKLGLIKVQSTHNPGFDAVDKGGNKYQIKTAVLMEKEYDVSTYKYMQGRNAVTNKQTRTHTYASFSQVKIGDWDDILFCLVSEQFEVLEIWGASQEELFDNEYLNNTVSFKRGQLKINMVRTACHLYYKK